MLARSPTSRLRRHCPRHKLDWVLREVLSFRNNATRRQLYRLVAAIRAYQPYGTTHTAVLVHQVVRTSTTFRALTCSEFLCDDQGSSLDTMINLRRYPQPLNRLIRRAAEKLRTPAENLPTKKEPFCKGSLEKFQI